MRGAENLPMDYKLLCHIEAGIYPAVGCNF